MWDLLTYIPSIDLEYIRCLGGGGNGGVHEYTYRGSPVAVKSPCSCHEVEMHFRAGLHQNIVPLRGICRSDGCWHIVMDSFPRGSLDRLLHHSNAALPLSTDMILDFAMDLGCGMRHLHTAGIVHGDFKPGNILIGPNNKLRICDFGSSSLVVEEPFLVDATASNREARTASTAAYCAPELIAPDSPAVSLAKEKGPSSLLKADVYSYGVTLWEILARQRPRNGLSFAQVIVMWYYAKETALPQLKEPKGLLPHLAGTGEAGGALHPARSRPAALLE